MYTVTRFFKETIPPGWLIWYNSQLSIWFPFKVGFVQYSHDENLSKFGPFCGSCSSKTGLLAETIDVSIAKLCFTYISIPMHCKCEKCWSVLRLYDPFFKVSVVVVMSTNYTTNSKRNKERRSKCVVNYSPRVFDILMSRIASFKTLTPIFKKSSPIFQRW